MITYERGDRKERISAVIVAIVVPIEFIHKNPLPSRLLQLATATSSSGTISISFSIITIRS